MRADVGVRRLLMSANLLALLLLSGASYAQQAPEDSGRKLLDAFLNDVTSLSASFEQSVKDGNLLLESSRGEMKIRRPGQFRWTYDEPYVQVLVADGLNVWSYDVDLAQVTVKPQADVLANTPALLLSGTRDFDDEFDYVDSFDEDGTVWVRLRPKNSDNGFAEVDLGFEAGILKRMTFRDTLAQTTAIVLSDARINEQLDDAHFGFDVPPDADLIGKPVTAQQVDE